MGGVKSIEAWSDGYTEIAIVTMAKTKTRNGYKKIAIINSDTAFIWIHIYLEVHENSILLRLSLNF